MDRFICVNCGFSISEQDVKSLVMSCPNCGHYMQVEFSREKYDPSALPNRAMTDSYKPLFTGSAAEYFRIWIVNTLFTVLTLGIYAAWAKVRNRQYFYRNTVLGNQPFDYLASPLAILKGNLIIAGGVLLYYAAELYNPVYSLIVFALFYLTVPLLIYKSLRFYAHNSSFRNIRFRFLGSPGESYQVYLLVSLLIPLTLGLIVPYWVYRQKKYFFGNFAFGATQNTFQGSARPFYRVYLTVFLMLMSLVIAMVLIQMLTSGNYAFPSQAENVPAGSFAPFIMALPVLTLVIMTFIQQYLYAWQANYCWGHSALGNLRFQSSLKAGRLFWIRLTNILAIIFSLGLLVPWAKVRRYRYILDNLTIYADHGLDDFYASSEPDESAVGDAAADFFDFEIGL